jgi:hypothetical protein
MTKLLVLPAMILALFLQNSAKAQVDPSIHWKVASTAHYDLIYDAEQQELADLYADRLEKARLKLGLLWKDLPERVTVILNDRTDLTNGYATSIFTYPHVMLFPVLPDPQETISEYGDWAEELVIHELTHIQSFEQRRGVPKFLYQIFGSVSTPNQVLPPWWLEGVAVDTETRLSAHGRLRSNYQDASLRALALSDRWAGIHLAELNSADTPTFPYGSRRYLYGSLMWSEMIALEGEKMVNDLQVAFGGRLPWFLSAPIQENY